jgi:hypothetical protein
LERALVIEHLFEDDLIVNTAQMRDATYLDAFRWTPNTLVTATVIKTAAENAFAERQKQKQIAEDAEGDAAEETSGPTADQLPSIELEPARKKSRTDREPNLPVPSGSLSHPVQQSSSSLRHVSTVRNDTLAIPPTQQTFTFENTFQSSYQD